MSDTQVTKVSARVSLDVRDAVLRIAAEQQTSAATIVRQALVAYLKHYETRDGNP